MNRKQRKAKLRAARARQKRKHHARTTSASRDHSQLTTVEGESSAALITALAKMRINAEQEDGSTTFDMRLSPEEMAPVMRAFMRIEAELLIEDAAALVDMAAEQRSDSERQADAFALLVQRTCAAVIEQHGDHRMICDSYEL